MDSAKGAFFLLPPEYAELLINAKLSATEYRIWLALIALNQRANSYERIDSRQIMQMAGCGKTAWYEAKAKFFKLGLFDFQEVGGVDYRHLWPFKFSANAEFDSANAEKFSANAEFDSANAEKFSANAEFDSRGKNPERLSEREFQGSVRSVLENELVQEKPTQKQPKRSRSKASDCSADAKKRTQRERSKRNKKEEIDLSLSEKGGVGEKTPQRTPQPEALPEPEGFKEFCWQKVQSLPRRPSVPAAWIRKFRADLLAEFEASRAESHQRVESTHRQASGISAASSAVDIDYLQRMYGTGWKEAARHFGLLPADADEIVARIE